jgi:hypothetical protein
LAGRSASKPVQARVCRPTPAMRTSVVLAGTKRKTRKRCNLGANCADVEIQGRISAGEF